MGQQPQAKAPQPTIDDVILDMRLSSKRFAREANRCDKEKDALMVKAKQALQKNNEEGAKLFLTSAMNKQKESENLMRMSHKMDHLQGIIKSTANQTQIMNSLNKITPMLTQQVNQMPLDDVYKNMNQFEAAMDEITVQSKVMDGMMNKNVDAGQDIALDQMMGQLKQEIHNQVSNDLNVNPQVAFNQLSQPQQQQQQQAMNNQYK
ncbi:hypothetical protein pb186bvf_008673 [Paramecium bursaria]